MKCRNFCNSKLPHFTVLDVDAMNAACEVCACVICS